MAKIIIIEGCSRSGKSSLAASLWSLYNIPHLVHPGHIIPKGLNEQEKGLYFKGAVHQLQLMQDMLPKDFVFIAERSAVSAYAYDLALGRETVMSIVELNNMYKAHDILSFNLRVDYKDYLERGAYAKDKFIYSADDHSCIERYIDSGLAVISNEMHSYDSSKYTSAYILIDAVKKLESWNPLLKKID
jgi:thymidylate kinase